MLKILIGSNNHHKVQEIREILPEYNLVTPADLGLSLEIDETGSTFEANAELKALAYCKASNLITLADDSGLEVACLDGAPGTYSHRYSPKPDATDADRRQFLRENLRDKKQPWSARFYCAIAIAVPGNDRVMMTHGICKGIIIDEERGNGGFGYDPIFFVPEQGKTLSEMTESEKNRISHRGNALRMARTLLSTLGKP
jgi:XTP/dITP diphosphohydrolase